MKIGNSFNTQALNDLNNHKTNTDSVLSKIAATRELSGKDSANLMIADSLNTQISSMTQGIQNSNEAIGMLQIADSTLQNLSQSADRLNELSVRQNNAALNSDQKAMLNQEFNATKEAMKDMVDNTTYNGKQLFGESMTFETGNSKVVVNALEVGDIDELDITDQSTIQQFVDSLSTTRSDIGSAMQKFEVGIANSLSAVSNLTSSKSMIEESPMDEKINDLSSNKIKLEASMLAQAHKNDQLQKRISALLI